MAVQDFRKAVMRASDTPSVVSPKETPGRAQTKWWIEA